MDSTFISYHIAERSFVAFIKREIHNKVSQRHFSEQRVGEIDIIVSELSSNLIKHAGSGEFLYRTYDLNDEESVFEVICLDNGPGIDDIQNMMKDGASTTKTLGQGLGAVSRLSSFAQWYSLKGWGTLAYAMVSSSEGARVIHRPKSQLDVRGLCVSKPREQVCGDAYGVKQTDKAVYLFLGDGLGHGEYAHEAVTKARDFFFECDYTDPADIIRYIHEKVRRTRGLVASVAVLDQQRNLWKTCGVGNILMRMYTGIVYRNYMSYNGTIGLNIPSTMKSSEYAAEKNQHLIMTSDGIRSRWDVTRYPSVYRYDSILLASAIYKDFGRGNDDASILIAKMS